MADSGSEESQSEEDTDFGSEEYHNQRKTVSSRCRGARLMR